MHILTHICGSLLAETDRDVVYPLRLKEFAQEDHVTLRVLGKISCLVWKGDIKIDQEFMTKNYDQKFMTKNSTENTAPFNLERTSKMRAAYSFCHLGRQVCCLPAVAIKATSASFINHANCEI